ncbi:MAG TPA: ABC transporter permease subunit [Thermoplasmata archaeon]|nr:ABC transporter permease subunit [Thermoplasmata archaeon]
MADGVPSGSVDRRSEPPADPGTPRIGARAPASPAASTARRSALRAAAIYAAIPLVAGGMTLATVGLSGSGIASYFPLAGVDVFYSFLRMLAAYAASLGFALAYGYYAATHRTGERVMIPVLDILQSVPILGFFPIAIVFFVDLTPGSWIGANLASVFLIFTSMAWNMVFGVYESLKTLPSDMKEAAETFHVRGILLFRRVLYPATINRLVYNSVLSWTGGWFFLVEAEIFTTNGSNALAGIGSYLSFAASAQNGDKFLAGILVLVIVIALLDFAVWRPLGHYAERFRFDQSPSGEAESVAAPDPRSRFRRATSYVTQGVRAGVTRITTPLVQFAAITIRPARKPSPTRRTILYYLALGVILVAVWLMVIAIAVAVFHVYTQPIVGSVRRQILQLPLAMGASTLRVVAAYAVCLGISLPLAYWIARRPRAGRVGLPIVEVIASFPATALFPVIIFELIPVLTPEGAAILMLMTGMIWYLFFNLLSGMRALPPDLEEASRSFGLKGRRFFWRVVLPGIFPALITGSITAFGGGWNTLIVAEYLNSGTGHSLSLLGIGQAIDIGYVEPNGIPLMVAALFTLIATVIAINELIWKPLYRRAVELYRYD